MLCAAWAEPHAARQAQTQLHAGMRHAALKSRALEGAWACADSLLCSADPQLQCIAKGAVRRPAAVVRIISSQVPLAEGTHLRIPSLDVEQAAVSRGQGRHHACKRSLSIRGCSISRPSHWTHFLTLCQLPCSQCYSHDLPSPSWD